MWSSRFADGCAHVTSASIHLYVYVVQGVVGAATGAGIIIGTYFAFYSTTKNCLKAHTDLSDGERFKHCT